VIAQLSNLSRSFCKASLSSMESTAPPGSVLLVNLLNVPSNPAARIELNLSLLFHDWKEKGNLYLMFFYTPFKHWGKKNPKRQQNKEPTANIYLIFLLWNGVSSLTCCVWTGKGRAWNKVPTTYLILADKFAFFPPQCYEHFDCRIALQNLF